MPLAAHSISSSLILPSSHPSTLQTYSPLTSTLISELEVSPSNRISRRDEKTLEPCRVEFAATSDSGEWLATVDTRPPVDGFRGEVYLKLWWWDRKASSWVLNTRIDRPHGLKRVTTVAFRPRARDQAGLSLVTAGEDGSVKTWGIRSKANKAGDSESTSPQFRHICYLLRFSSGFWVARSTLRSKSDVPSQVSWSYDGSLMAVASGAYVVLYDPNTALALRTIMCPECEVVSSVSFIGKASRYLAIRSHTDLVLWDLITESGTSGMGTITYNFKLNYSSSSLALSELIADHPSLFAPSRRDFRRPALGQARPADPSPEVLASLFRAAVLAHAALPPHQHDRVPTALAPLERPELLRVRRHHAHLERGDLRRPDPSR